MPNFKNNLASLLINYRNRYPEAEALYQEIIQLSPDNPWYITGLANFYHKKTKQLDMALEAYEVALVLMKKHPNFSNFLTEKNIVNRMNKIKRKVRKRSKINSFVKKLGF